MKKIAIYGLASLFALSFVACDNYEEPNPTPQTNPQEPIFKASDITVTNDFGSEVYDLTSLAEAGSNIKVATISSAVEPEGYTFGSKVLISADDFANSYTVASTVEASEEGGYVVCVSPTDLENVYFDNISKAPAEKELKARVLVETVIGSQVAIVGSPDNFYGPYTFRVKPMTRMSYLYTPGDSNGWNQEQSQRLYSFDSVKFNGYALLSGAFKFTSQPNWDGVNYGFGGEEGTLSTDGDASNLEVASAGLYYCNADVEKLTYSVAQVNTYGVIGDATPGGWDASTALTPSDDSLVWTGTIEFKGGEFKFRANDAWDINLGGDMSSLTQGGDNIASPGEGTYEVTLNLRDIPYSCTLVKK